MINRIKLIIFDVDGTLVDAYKAIQKSLNFTLKKLDYTQASAYAVRRAVGWGDERFIKTFIKSKDAENGLIIYRQHHKTSLLKNSRVIPKVKNILTILKKRNYKLAIASNRPGAFTDILLKHLGLKKYFDLVICAKDKTEIKPKPLILIKVLKKLKIGRQEALYAGDMAIDVLAGKNAGIKTIAVLGGSSSRAQLKQARPFKLISNLSGLLSFLKV